MRHTTDTLNADYEPCKPGPDELFRIAHALEFMAFRIGRIDDKLESIEKSMNQNATRM